MIDHEIKLAILKILRANPGNRNAANELARKLGTTQATISRHLTELLEQHAISHCVMNQRKYYFVPTDDEIAAKEAAPGLPNWKTAKDYKSPIAMQRRVAEIQQHRARFPSVYEKYRCENRNGNV